MKHSGRSILNVTETILKNINALFIVPFYKYSFSFDTL